MGCMYRLSTLHIILAFRITEETQIFFFPLSTMQRPNRNTFTENNQMFEEIKWFRNICEEDAQETIYQLTRNWTVISYSNDNKPHKSRNLILLFENTWMQITNIPILCWKRKTILPQRVCRSKSICTYYKTEQMWRIYKL